jgi:Protein of unknown function (DUF4240)
MDEGRFWAIIEAGAPYGPNDQDQHERSVADQLRDLPAEDIHSFYTLFCRKMVAAQTWDLWGAAYLVNGGCSDDGFVYFRAWLIGQGRAAYAAAVADPDALAGLTDPSRDDYEFEMLYAAAPEAYAAVTGEDMPHLDVEWPAEPQGERWDFDDSAEAHRRLPRLASLHQG